jgi:hypothetical protein
MRVRNKKENSDYVEYLETAIDLINQAIDSVSYPGYPEINQNLIAKLEEAKGLLEACSRAGVFKP